MATSNTLIFFFLCSLCLILSKEASSQLDELWLVGDDDDPLNALQTRHRRREEKCDYSVGKWTYDETYPLYESNCPYLSSALSCQRNGRPDSYYQKWRWIPKAKACSLPRHTLTTLSPLTSFFETQNFCNFDHYQNNK
ncbi:unnamed protein product [Arabis nemorensis]|uniref:Trichome birefringence-like N-terminal domain-containing protein n=1 Tax=Arabis nemorensis TaxID=586526 RepID=A0A565BW61_9BRAS|nr:unnamed protein product [Arabis nemorensis]